MKRQHRGREHGNEDPPHRREEKRSRAAVVLHESGGKSDCVVRNICIPCHRILLLLQKPDDFVWDFMYDWSPFPCLPHPPALHCNSHTYTRILSGLGAGREGLSPPELLWFSLILPHCKLIDAFMSRGKEPKSTTRRRTRGGEIRRFRVLN